MKNKEKIIKYQQYLNLFTEQKFYIWNEFEESQLLPSKNQEFLNLDKEDDDEEKLIHLWWDENQKKYLKTLNDNDKSTKMWVNINKQLLEYLKSITKYDNKDIFINKNIDSLETKIITTKDAMNNKNVSLIINPCFAYKTKNDFLVMTTFFAYDKKRNIAYFNGFTSKTKVLDYINTDYIFNVFKRSQNINLTSIKKIIFDNNVDTKANVASFCLTEASLTKKSPSASENQILDINNNFWPYKDIENKGWNFCSPLFKKNLNDKSIDKLTYLDVIQEREIFKGTSIKKDSNDTIFIMNKDNSIFNKELSLNDYDENIEYIEKLFDEEVLLDFENTYVDQLSNGSNKKKNYNSELYKNPIDTFVNKDKIKQYFLNKLGEDYYFSSKYLNIVKSFSKEDFDNWKSLVDNERTIPDFFTIDVLYFLSLLHIKDKRIIWYDYEGIAIPTPILDGAKHYQQVTPQVSIIETVNGKEIYSKDIVKDPAKLELFDLVDNVVNVYANAADYYVVYNQGYENSKNKQLLELVEKSYGKDLNFTKKFDNANLTILKFREIVNHIKNKTIDLNILFKPFTKSDSSSTNEILKKWKLNFDINYLNNNVLIEFNPISIGDKRSQIKYHFYNKNNLSLDLPKTIIKDNFKSLDKGIFLNIFELRGFSSIKKIEKLITKYHIKLKHKIKPYASLEVKNGLFALEKAINRHQGLIGDKEWEETSNNLKIYCHNDVMMMIEAYDLVQKIVADVFPEIEKYEWNLEQNQTYGIDFKNHKLIILNKIK